MTQEGNRPDGQAVLSRVAIVILEWSVRPWADIGAAEARPCRGGNLLRCHALGLCKPDHPKVAQPELDRIHSLLIKNYRESAATCSRKGTAFGVPRPVTSSHPGPVLSDESVPKVNTSHRVEVGLWNSALM